MAITPKVVFFLLSSAVMALAASPKTAHATRIIVGGPQHWHFGYNYSDWAIKSAPFYINDTLVFMYDPPGNGTFPHSVYLMKNRKSYNTCNLKQAKVVAGVAQGGGKGFEFVLKKTKRPYFFACGESGGFHCNQGAMKFAVLPVSSRCEG